LSVARSAAIHHCVFLQRRAGPAVWRYFERSAAVNYFLKYLAPRDTARARIHLQEFLKSPLLLEYGHVDDAARALRDLVGVAS